MGSKNEYDKLKKVIVGVADHATRPDMSLDVRCINYADRKDSSNIEVGYYPDQVVEEANEDLETLCEFLRGESVEVVRPYRNFVNYYNYCPRDTSIINDDVAIIAPMSLECRQNEYLNYVHHLKYTSHVLTHYTESMINMECLSNPDVLALNETYPRFDAANVIRSNDDWLYLVSNTGNKKGAEVLQEYTKAKIHLLENVYSYIHIDSTIAFLREGLMLVNPSRIKSRDVLPEPFKSWDIIYAPEPTDIGHYPGICMASTWVNINLLTVNPNLVVLEEHQHETRKELEKYGIECAMLPMRHSRTLGGCFHCVTLDLEREHV